MKVLITGFDPFGGESINPAFEAIKALPSSIGDIEIVKLEIPTVFYTSLEHIEAAIEAHKPKVVICVGQAGGRFDMTLEKVGININEARIPDNEGVQLNGTPIYEDGPTAYFSTLPLKAIVKEMRDANLPASVSYTAGTYVCNHVLYGLMYMIEKKYPNVKGGFIHVPFLPEQVISKGKVAFMPLDMISKALEIAIRVSASVDEDIELVSGETH